MEADIIYFTMDNGMAAQPRTEFLPQIDPARCTGCELCVKMCPQEVLGLVGRVAEVVNPAACEYSATCQEVCPTGAVSLPYEIVF
jgi:ferredoxin